MRNEKYNPANQIIEDLNLDLYAPIIPGESIGGLKLKTKLKDIQEKISALRLADIGGFKLESITSAYYTIGNDIITICVDVRNGKVFKLIAGKGYKGALFGKIKTGMKVKEAMRLDSRLYYDEPEEVILCKGVEGLSISVSEIDPPPELVPRMKISGISVHLKDLITQKVQAGDW